MMIDDIFCKIVNKELSAEVVLEGEDWLAVKDINPQAPIHVLIMPKKHLSGLSEARERDKILLGNLMLAVNKVAEKLDLMGDGYRLIINHGKNGGQAVPHLHIHLLGGKVMGPKMVR